MNTSQKIQNMTAPDLSDQLLAAYCTQVSLPRPPQPRPLQLQPNSKAGIQPKKNKTEKSKEEHTIFRTDSHRAPSTPNPPQQKNYQKGKEKRRDPEVSDAGCRRVNGGFESPLRRARLSRAEGLHVFRRPVSISGTEGKERGFRPHSLSLERRRVERCYSEFLICLFR